MAETRTALPQLPQGGFQGFPNFNMPQFPYANMPQQLQASMQMPQGGTYPRFGNALGGMPGGLPQLPNGQMPQLPAGGAGQSPQQAGMMNSQLGALMSAMNGMGGGTGGAQQPPPGMDQANFGPSPPIPQGGSNQQFNTANSVASQMQSPTGRTFLANLSKYGPAGVAKFLSTPQSFSVADFNKVAATNPVLAAQMQAAGGQNYRNAIMQGNGWNNYQNNSFINANGAGALPGFGADQMSLLRSLGIG